ncbi:MAG: trimethylamine methyltransferase family protein [Acidobacteria bacterium]|nr:trimethylamine methyltransferase family protein [Acidobacteriota bacterium]
MLRGYRVQIQPSMRFLSDEQIQEIHLASLDILERTGVVVHHPEVIELLLSEGCSMRSQNTVRIPSFLVEQALESIPCRIALYGRSGGKRLLVEDRKSYWGTGSDTPFIIDSFSGCRRQTTLQDIENAARVVDACENLDFLMCMGVAHELPQAIADKYHFVAMAANSSKPIVYTASSLANMEDIYRMAVMIAGSEEALRERNFIVHYTEPISPLIHPRGSLEKLLFCIDRGIPVIYTSATTTSQNGPATLAGALALSVARMLSGLLIGQLRRRGAPMIVTFHGSSMDPRTAIHTYTSPEHVILQAAARDMAAYYRIPTWGRAGCTDSKVLDQQAAFEAGCEIFMQALSGENLIHDVGYLESGLTASLDSIVMCDEFIGVAKRMIQGFELSEETLALDVIHEVGPEGHFLTHDHTVRHYRKETWIPRLIDRSSYQQWEEKGRTTLFDRINRRVREILESHEVVTLPASLLEELNRLAARETGSGPPI